MTRTNTDGRGRTRTNTDIPSFVASRGGVIVVALLLLPASWLFSQQRRPHFSTSSNLVLVDVRILDKQGQPIRGLTADDFTIIEDGVAQTVGYFREISLPLSIVQREQVRAVPEAAQTPKTGPVAASQNPSTGDKRLLVFLFDLSNASLQDIQTMQETGRKFVQEQLTPLDSTAVLVLDNGLQMLSDLTSDPAILTRAFRRLTSGNPEQDISEAEEGAEADSEFVADQTELALFQTNQQLSAIQSVADAFRDVTGRKALVYFSAGLRSSGVENDEQMRWAVDTCNRANMSVYSVDARGLVALSPGGGAQRAGGRGAGMFTGRSSLDQMSTLVDSQNGLVTLAAETGGAALVDDNDLSKVVRQAREDGSHYYMLGYYVTTATRDGRFRRIDVRTRNKYPTIVARRGYYAEKPYISLTKAERELALLKSVVEDLPASELPLTISAEYFPDASQGYEVVLLLSFDYDEVSRMSGAEDLNLEIVMLARDAAGQAQAGLRDSLEIKSRRQENEARFVYENLLVLPPGQYQLYAYVRDNRAGKMSRTVFSLDLPAESPMRSSSLVLAGSWRSNQNSETYRVKSHGNVETILQNPLIVSGRALIPRVDGQFKPGETLYIHGKVRVPASESSGVEFRVILDNREGQRLFQGDWQTLRPSSDQVAGINARLPLAQLAPGAYTVGAEIRSADGKSAGRLTRQFAIVP
ncbi:MAG: VWA domain-containing protein [Acidobacteria bacterium]|nr:MAG: VWA domain-containing protein [Acidobacteriota bacterium]